MWIVEQTFETLGDPCRQKFYTLAIADAYAADLRETIVKMVMGCELPHPDDLTPSTGWMNEIEAWREAVCMSGDSDTYTREAAEYIADQAVEITKA